MRDAGCMRGAQAGPAGRSHAGPPGLPERLDHVRRRIAEAARRAGRDPHDVTLVAVTKTVDVCVVRDLVELGVRDLGESRPQILWEKAAALAPPERGQEQRARHEKTEPVRWHLVGHLQRNKARRTLPLVHLIHSCDSLRLLEHLNALAGEMKLRPRVLLEVNVSGEAAKHGFARAELIAAWPRAAELEHLAIEGLMTVAPLEAEPERTRPVFAALRALRDELRQRFGAALPHLSMGMTNDFEVAIEEGATIVRIGTALFAPAGEGEAPAEPRRGTAEVEG